MKWEEMSKNDKLREIVWAKNAREARALARVLIKEHPEMRTSIALEAVREGSNTGKSPQHQAAHHRMDHGLATLA